jgi:hypothetical protein
VCIRGDRHPSPLKLTIKVILRAPSHQPAPLLVTQPIRPSRGSRHFTNLSTGHRKPCAVAVHALHELGRRRRVVPSSPSWTAPVDSCARTMRGSNMPRRSRRATIDGQCVVCGSARAKQADERKRGAQSDPQLRLLSCRCSLPRLECGWRRVDRPSHCLEIRAGGSWRGSAHRAQSSVAPAGHGGEWDRTASASG